MRLHLLGNNKKDNLLCIYIKVKCYICICYLSFDFFHSLNAKGHVKVTVTQAILAACKYSYCSQCFLLDYYLLIY